MERHVFAQRLVDAATLAREFARNYIEEQLPDAMRFHVRLNSSYDGNPLHADERVFPEDSGRELVDCAVEEAVAVLFRARAVPEWINVSVHAADRERTTIELLSCGRYTENETLLYHQQEGRPPFHVLGPTLPPDWKQGERFSIYHRTECSRRVELAGLAPQAAKVWSLTLIGEEIDDACIEQLPTLPNVEILELRGTRWSGASFAALARHAKLRVLRAAPVGARFELPPAPRLPLQNVTLQGLPGSDWGLGELLSAAPALSCLWLHGDALCLDLNSREALETLSLSGRRADGKLPRRMRDFYAHLMDASESELDALLAGVEHVENLNLSGTRVGYEFVERLLERWPLRYLNVVDTLVSDEEVGRIAAARPRLKLLPNLTSLAPASPQPP